MEENGLYAEEQNGVRQCRSCLEHLFVLTTIIRNRNLQGKSTFTAFLDAEKTFDRVNRDLLLFKLLNLGIKGHIYEVRRVFLVTILYMLLISYMFLFVCYLKPC